MKNTSLIILFGTLAILQTGCSHMEEAYISDDLDPGMEGPGLLSGEKGYFELNF